LGHVAGSFRQPPPHLPRRFNHDDFSFYLSVAWRNAKMAALSSTERQITVVREELDGLKFKPLRIDIATRRRSLEAELAALTLGI
jgi:hypothetical protein